MIVLDIKTNGRLENIADDFISDIQSLSKKHKIELEVKKDTSISDLEKVVINPIYISKEVMSKNYQSFHKEYLDKYVNDERFNLMVMEIQ